MIGKLYWWLLIAAVLLLSTQVLAVVVYAYSFIPYPAFWHDPFLKGVEPERDTLFYGIFLVTAVVLTALGVKWFLPRLSSPEMQSKFKLWLVLEAVWCFLMVFCFFKWTTYRYPFYNMLPYENSKWLVPFFYAVCGLALLSKVFFPEIDNCYKRVQVYAARQSWPLWYAIIFQAVFIAGVALLIFIPRPQDVTALALVWDQWNHLDPVAGWFIKHGWYINYDETVQVLVVVAIIYVIGLFYFIRLWLNSWLLAAIGALLAIKMGMFYYGVAPCIWINPANTFLSHAWDIFLFFGLWGVSVKRPEKFYVAAGVTGLVLLLVWFKSNGYLDAFGLDNQPLYAPLRGRQFFPFFMGYFVPLFYVFSLLVLTGQKDLQRPFECRLPAVICIYGLMIFVDYLEHPITGYYGALMVPAILIMLWWLRQLFLSSTLLLKRGVWAGIFLLVLGALLTNRLMLTYPDVLYQDKERFAGERVFYGHFDAITQSASLITQLTKKEDKVVLLSNFETALLMQAHRQPLFKDFPVMFSNLNGNPGGLNLKTKKQCLGLIDSLEEENALYVFVDARLMALSPQDLGSSGLNALLGYIRNHYQVYTRRGFLVALQRQ